MTFVGRFFLLVLVVGFVEVYLLIKVGASLGFLATVGLCVLTGVVGGSLVRAQGLRTLMHIQKEMQQGRMPATEVVSGVVLLIVGVLLVMPGFMTDVLGFLLLVPVLRQILAGRIATALEGRIQAFGPPMGGFADPFSQQQPSLRGEVIDVQGEKVGRQKPMSGSEEAE